MARLAKATAAYVAARWPEYLVRLLETRDDLRSFIDFKEYNAQKKAATNYSAVVRTSALGRYLAAPERDNLGDNADTWRRNLDRWLSRQAAPLPEMIRRTLTALSADWLLGLGVVGYRLHAIALLFQLWKDGHRTELAGPAIYAKAIFGDDQWVVWVRDTTFVAARDILTRPFSDETYEADASETFTRLSRSAKSLWGDGEIPIVAAVPGDLSQVPELHRMWMMIRSASASGPKAYEKELNSWQPVIAQIANEWANRLIVAKVDQLRQARKSIAFRLGDDDESKAIRAEILSRAEFPDGPNPPSAISQTRRKKKA